MVTLRSPKMASVSTYSRQASPLPIYRSHACCLRVKWHSKASNTFQKISLTAAAQSFPSITAYAHSAWDVISTFFVLLDRTGWKMHHLWPQDQLRCRILFLYCGEIFAVFLFFFCTFLYLAVWQSKHWRATRKSHKETEICQGLVVLLIQSPSGSTQSHSF